MERFSFPLKEQIEHGAEFRWKNKPVLRSRPLDMSESRWRLVEQGRMEFTDERSVTGARAVRIISPTLSSKAFQTEAPGRPHGKSSVMLTVDGEDWTGFNRISFRVYPTLPGFRVISMSVRLHNDGTVKVPDKYEREGIHYFLLQPDRWNHMVWEIAHLPRDRVTGLEFACRLQGSDRGAAKEVMYDLDDIRLEEVEPDYVEGWPVAPGRVAFSHVGYAAGARKLAAASSFPDADAFEIVADADGAVVFAGRVEHRTLPTGTFQLMDFTPVCTPGRYRIRIGGTETPPFRVDDRAWREPIVKTVNFFFTERCGYHVPGIHGVCHRDWRVRHPDGREIVTNGGWHDAGDLSQGLVNTAEAVYAMLALAEKLKRGDPALADRLAEEAMWGLEWMLATRFGDGYRTVWSTMDLWTDNIIGTFDDEVCEADNDPFANAVAACAEALAGRLLAERDPVLARACLQAAREDAGFALEKRASFDALTAAQTILALTELYRAEGREADLALAAELSRFVMDCQQRRVPEWDVPLHGYFCTHPDLAKPMRFDHRGHEQAPAVALCSLMELAPDHELWMEWYGTVKLHASYLCRGAGFAEPYGMLAASVYRLDEAETKEDRAQIRQGIPLADGVYLRRFPVWHAFRGNSGTILSQAKALTAAARAGRNWSFAELANRQLYWQVGFNPFGQSLMYGEGYDFAPQYSAMSGNLVGSLPVGIQTRGERDEPYWPVQTCYNYKETWVHPNSRLLWLMCDLYGESRVVGRLPRDGRPVRLIHGLTGETVDFAPGAPDGVAEREISPGPYRVVAGDVETNMTFLPGTVHMVDFGRLVRVELRLAGGSRLQAVVHGRGRPVELELRLFGASVREEVSRTVTLPEGGGAAEVEWTLRTEPAMPWIALVIPDGRLELAAEIEGIG
jgi:hypothetical protein